MLDRNPNTPATEQGVFRKYEVHRVDGREDPDGTEYFVLKLSPAPDPLALVALDAYATAANLAGYKALAGDLTARIDAAGGVWYPEGGGSGPCPRCGAERAQVRGAPPWSTGTPGRCGSCGHTGVIEVYGADEAWVAWDEVPDAGTTRGEG
jgi:hypothetical protein